MPARRQRSDRPRHGLGSVAVLTALAFGCTTIRAPVAAMGSPIPVREGRASPELELWLESARPISPEEGARVAARARAALEAALAGREVGDGSTVLVVRAQGVTRAPSHKRDQVAATAGLALVAVVVIVGLVLWLASGDSGGGGGGGAATRGGAGARPPPPAASPALPVAHAARPPPAAPRPPPASRRPPPVPSRPPPVRHDAAVGVGVYVDVGPIPLQPAPEEPVVVSTREWSAPGPQAAAEAWPAGEAEVTPAPVGQVVLPAFAPFPVEERSFFDGDSLVLELTLVDRLTGEPRWTKWVEERIDPLDHEAVRRLLDRALGEAAGWQPAP